MMTFQMTPGPKFYRGLGYALLFSGFLWALIIWGAEWLLSAWGEP